MTKPRIFIASASETLDLAHDVQSNLDRFAEVTVWDQDVFKPSKTAMQSLTTALQNTDFAIFIFTPTDTLKMRNKLSSVPRDNVIFELGVFSGYLGIERCFMILPRNTPDLHLPSDLVGLMHCEYEPNRTDGNQLAALAPACGLIKRTVIALWAKKDVFYVNQPIGNEVPHLLTSNLLKGYWLSRFDYKAMRNGRVVKGTQCNLEFLEPLNKFCLTGHSVVGVSNKVKVYDHLLKIQIVGNNIVGQWYNTNSNNVGAFQLYLNTQQSIMKGLHLGNDNNNTVQHGKWTWIKIDSPGTDIDEDSLKRSRLLSSIDILSKFDQWVKSAQMLTLEDLYRF